MMTFIYNNGAKKIKSIISQANDHSFIYSLINLNFQHVNYYRLNRYSFCEHILIAKDYFLFIDGYQLAEKKIRSFVDISYMNIARCKFV